MDSRDYSSDNRLDDNSKFIFEKKMIKEVNIMQWYWIVMVGIVLGIILYSIKKEKKK